MCGFPRAPGPMPGGDPSRVPAPPCSPELRVPMLSGLRACKAILPRRALSESPRACGVRVGLPVQLRSGSRPRLGPSAHPSLGCSSAVVDLDGLTACPLLFKCSGKFARRGPCWPAPASRRRAVQRAAGSLAVVVVPRNAPAVSRPLLCSGATIRVTSVSSAVPLPPAGPSAAVSRTKHTNHRLRLRLVQTFWTRRAVWPVWDTPAHTAISSIRPKTLELPTRARR